MARIDRIVAAPPPYGPALLTLAHGILSGAVSQFLGGGWHEIVVAAVLVALDVPDAAAERARGGGRAMRVGVPRDASTSSAAATISAGSARRRVPSAARRPVPILPAAMPLAPVAKMRSSGREPTVVKCLPLRAATR